MTTRFLPVEELVVVRATLHGPNKKRATLRLALDTGATRTVLPRDALVGVGYDPDASRQRTHITTGSGIVRVPLLSVKRLRALQQTGDNLRVVVHTLPIGASVDGLLGLDFLRQYVLMVDFPRRRLELARP